MEEIKTENGNGSGEGHDATSGDTATIGTAELASPPMTYDYTPEYYAKYEKRNRTSADRVLGRVKEVIEGLCGEPMTKKKLMDVGCGAGDWVESARAMGIDAIGIDPNAPKPEPYIRREDIFQQYEHIVGREIVLCLEVAEHIPEEFADRLVARLCELSTDYIVFSAAAPGQGGEGHVNEQWPDYWTEKFAKHGFGFFHDPRMALWDDDEIWPWYRQNTVIYKKGWNTGEKPCRLIHPALWTGLRRKMVQAGALSADAPDLADLRHASENAEADCQTVLLGIPCGTPSTDPFLTHAMIEASQTRHTVLVKTETSSALTANFNNLWCEALNRRASHGIKIFGMIHNDVTPLQPDWIDRLIDLLIKSDADVVSVIIPIKDDRGLTSTGFDTDLWRPRRLTMHESMLMPPTWSNEDVRKIAAMNLGILEGPIGDVIFNTGLWVARVDRPWAEEVCFDISNRITKDPATGLFGCDFEPEDWKFSRFCNAKGLKCLVTREIEVNHAGHRRFPNSKAWGTNQRDTQNIEHLERMKKIANEAAGASSTGGV